MRYCYERGTVWWVDLPFDKKSHIQGGTRPCVIISNELDRCGVVTVCPLTTKIDNIPTHVKVNLEKEGQVLVEQITTVDMTRISNYYGTLDNSDMTAITNTLIAYLTDLNVQALTCEK